MQMIWLEIGIKSRLVDQPELKIDSGNVLAFYVRKGFKRFKFESSVEITFKLFDMHLVHWGIKGQGRLARRIIFMTSSR